MEYKYAKYEDTIKKLYENGKSLKHIEKELGISDSTIQCYLVRLNVPLRKRGGGQKGRKLSDVARRNIAQAKIGEKNPHWKGNNVAPNAGRGRARRKFGCINGLEIHHVDGDALNNNLENIKFVTRKEHMIIDGRLSRRDAKGRFCGLALEKKLGED